MNLKFRVWNKEERKYCSIGNNGEDIALGTDGTIYLLSSYGWGTASNYDNYIVEHSTGLFDDDGQEIYEGSIISFDLTKGNIHPAGTYIGKVFFTQKTLNFQIKYKKEFSVTLNPMDQFYMGMVRKSIKVLGNIHENPELVAF